MAKYEVLSYETLCPRLRGEYNKKFLAYFKAKLVKFLTRSKIPLAIIIKQTEAKPVYDWIVPFGPVKEKIHADNADFVGINNENRCDVLEIEEVDDIEDFKL